MKKHFVGACALALALFSVYRIHQRLREEQTDQRVVVVSEWGEVRNLVLRLGLSESDILSALRQTGVTAILVSPNTIREYAGQGMTFPTRRAAEAVREQLLHRGFTHVSLVPTDGAYRLTHPSLSWDAVSDVKLGLPMELSSSLKAAGMHAIVRIEHDAWLPLDAYLAHLDAWLADVPKGAVLFSSDLMPGGSSALPRWTEWIAQRNLLHMMMEFKPTRSARMIASRHPARTYRAHTVAASELRDLLPAQEKARWSRAVKERSCRMLWVRPALDDSWVSYLERIQRATTALEGQAVIYDWPSPRPRWKTPSPYFLKASQVFALFLAILTPILALLWGRRKGPWASFFSIVCLTLLGASVVAALSDHPLSRLHVSPFRGVKISMLVAWAGCFGVLFSREELRAFFAQSLKRIDLVVLTIGLGILAYLLLRTGNANASWKAGWEQALRDFLEQVLVARPRFKEFAVGYPLLILGLHESSTRWGRFMIGIGMIGPITMVNTFCHLHSPLTLAYWRSWNGIAVGVLIGVGLLLLRQWARQR